MKRQQRNYYTVPIFVPVRVRRKNPEVWPMVIACILVIIAMVALSFPAYFLSLFTK